VRHSIVESRSETVLAEGKARTHRWAPEAGYVTFVVNNEKDLEPAMALIQMSHGRFDGRQSVPEIDHQ